MVDKKTMLFRSNLRAGAIILRAALIFVASILTLCPAFSNSAHASLYTPVMLSELATDADIVVRAYCDSIDAKWEGGTIYSTGHFRVLSAIKAGGEKLVSLDSMIDIKFLGGSVGEISQHSSAGGFPTVGETSVLFLHRDKSGALSVLRTAQGMFRVAGDSAIVPDEVIIDDPDGEKAIALRSIRIERLESLIRLASSGVDSVIPSADPQEKQGA